MLPLDTLLKKKTLNLLGEYIAILVHFNHKCLLLIGDRATMAGKGYMGKGGFTYP